MTGEEQLDRFCKHRLTLLLIAAVERRKLYIESQISHIPSEMPHVLQRERVKKEKNTSSITMFTIVKMSGMLLPGLRHASTGTTTSFAILAQSAGSRHRTSGRHFERARGCVQPSRVVVSSFMKAPSAGRHSDQSRSAADAPDGAGQFTFLASLLRGTGMPARRSGLRLEGWRRIVRVKRR